MIQEVISVTTTNLALAIEAAREVAGLSQRELEQRTGISQATLSRILTGKRVAKMTEVMLIADALGCTVPELTGSGARGRVQCAARATNGATMETLHSRLLHFIELDAYLDDQAISVAAR